MSTAAFWLVFYLTATVLCDRWWKPSIIRELLIMFGSFFVAGFAAAPIYILGI